MGDFNRGRGPRDNNRFGGGRSFDRPRFGGGRDSAPREGGNRQMHHAICANCGKDCEVPFRPREDKPVYCSDCFEMKGGRSGRDEGRSRFERPQFNDNSRPTSTGNNTNYQQQFDALNAKLDKIMRLLTPVETPKEVTAEILAVEEPVKVEKKRLTKKTTKKA